MRVAGEGGVGTKAVPGSLFYSMPPAGCALLTPGERS